MPMTNAHLSLIGLSFGGAAFAGTALLGGMEAFEMAAVGGGVVMLLTDLTGAG